LQPPIERTSNQVSQDGLAVVQNVVCKVNVM